MKRKAVVEKTVFITLLLSIALLVITIQRTFFQIYGNDRKSITKIIQRNYPVCDIVDVVDYQKYRFVGFVSDNGRLGFAEFEKNNWNNFEWSYTTVESAPNGIDTFFKQLPKERDSNARMQGVTLTVSNNPAFKKMKRMMDDQYTDEKEVDDGRSMVLLEVRIPENYYYASYGYYDIDGNKINSGDNHK